MRRIACALLLVAAGPFDGTYQHPPLSQSWSDPGLIIQTDRWDGVPGFVGYRGDNLTNSPGASPDTILAPGDAAGPVMVLANQGDPSTLSTGGIAEFAIADPVIALQGSGTADAPHLVLRLNSAGKGNVRVRYRCRDIDGSADNATQPVAFQYRASPLGNFVNIPAAFVADATRGPSLAGFDTVISVQLPPDADNCSELQVRWITANAPGSDEWVGIDDIDVTAEPLSGVSEDALPGRVTLSSFPNPFNPIATIRFDLPAAAEVSLKIFDLRAREVAILVCGVREAGMHEVTFDGSGLSSGVYYSRLETGGFIRTFKLLIVR